mgnify:CR=1 FL=1
MNPFTALDRALWSACEYVASSQTRIYAIIAICILAVAAREGGLI